MQKQAERHFKSLVVVSKDQIRKSYALVELASESDEDAKRLRGDRPPVDIRVDHRSGDKETFHDVEEIFEISNSSADPIESITLQAGYLSRGQATIKLGGSWSSRYGANLSVNAPPSVTSKAIEDFNSIYDKDKGFLESFLSLNPILLSILLIALVHLGLGWLSDEINMSVSRTWKAPDLAGVILVTWLGPLSLLWAPVDYALYRFVGRAVFKWDDGEVRFEKVKKVLTFALWTVPTGIAIKALSSQLAG